MTNDLSTEQRDVMELLEAAPGWKLEYHDLRAELERRGRAVISLNGLGELARRKLIEYDLESRGFASGALGRYQLTYEGRELLRRSA